MVLLCEVHSRDAADPSRLSLVVRSGSSSVRLSAARFATRFRFDSNSFLQTKPASAVRGTHRLPASFAIGPSGSTLRAVPWSVLTLDDSVAHLLDAANLKWLRNDWDSSLVERFGSAVADLVSEVTDDKSVPKAERKRLQVENAPHKSIRAQQIKLADKISNLRAILASPPADWNFQRKKEYFEWAKRVVDGLRAPNPVLKAEFDKTWERFDGLVQEAAGSE